MQAQNDRGLLYEFVDVIIVIVSLLLLLQTCYILLILWAAFTRRPWVLGISEHDESHNV